jgi:type VI secretion system secreted protein VgrG
VVVGEGGNGNVQTDKYGCIKVRFHWDHHSPEQASHTSAFIRVAGPAAGSQRGFIFTPRVGEEVVVSFEDGNPDQPLVIGSVYSSHNPPAHSPIARPFTSLIKTDDAKDSNQIVFDDKPGAESFRFIAKKDMKIEVGGSLAIDVARDVTIKARSVTIQVANDMKVKANGNIINLSLATINNLAGVAITSTALGGILNIAGGIVKNSAGGIISNTAILAVANTSALGIKQEAQGVVANTAAGAVLNTGSEVINNGALAVVNTSNLAILNIASGDIKNQAVLQKNTISGISNTEADSVAIKGITKVNG